ncbi:methyl-accepting chemotaxis protein [Paenibacillus sp. VCA1]|uniref:methyl-accepting chemotaxis protein n=1 Tax=Paenibacillus sp. VCA1 TaxID=3039148 RepID=UPI0028715324|nr:methyl-accepting chemotaxis protein [Paenibacillus sp. VCA1]MDR9853325.1 methyl-accepting chemotaxis protein [Paenibacillus sp. VCA1]
MKVENSDLQKQYRMIGLKGAGCFAGAVVVINLICLLCGLPVWAGLIASLVLGALAGYFITAWLLRSAGAGQSQGLFASGGANSAEHHAGSTGDHLHKFGLQYKELSDEFNTRISRMAGTIDEVKASAEMGFYVSDMIKEATLGVSGDASQQTEMIRTSSNTVGDVVNAIRHIAGSADEVAAAAGESSEKSAEGQEAIVAAMKQMDEANTTVHTLVEMMNRLDESSREVVSFVAMIREIAEQTHLLSLNAAIEAARFGDEGRGFSVIASEIRNLAEQSSNSAKQVTQVVSVILKETTQAVASTKLVAEQVGDGLKVVNQAGESFEFIKLSIGEVAGQIQEVSSAVEEIAAGAEQLVVSMEKTEEIAVKTMSEMNSVTQAVEEHHSIMEQISNATETLSAYSKELELSIQKYHELLGDAGQPAKLVS